MRHVESPEDARRLARQWWQAAGVLAAVTVVAWAMDLIGVVLLPTAACAGATALAYAQHRAHDAWADGWIACQEARQ